MTQTNENRKQINSKLSSSSLTPVDTWSLSSFITNKNTIRSGITSLYLLRICSISAPNLWTMIFRSSSIYLTELLFWLSNIGFNWLLYKSDHLTRFSKEKRLIYSSFLSTIFNFGSLIIVNSISHFFGRVESLRLISSLTLSTCLLSIGYSYIDEFHSNQ
ncbi:hypothetical protein I4U23_018988 [Adineta vaga]|nr:hypothetical protein I4U23_018988 [Adineta vaga]